LAGRFLLFGLGVNGLGGVLSIRRKTSSRVRSLPIRKFNFPFLAAHPNYIRILGRILLAYGELEVDLMNAVATAQDMNIAIKVMYRMRGESQRIQVADGLAREVFKGHGLETVFSEAIGDMAYATSIRNQYAHCSWDKTGKKISFVDIEAVAQSNGLADKTPIVRRTVTLQLLKQQESFFAYVQSCLCYLKDELRRRKGEVVETPWPKPGRPGSRG